jgi:hypothetical protein
VPEDRFGDLGGRPRHGAGGPGGQPHEPDERAGAGDERSAADRLAELDERAERQERERSAEPAPPPRVGSRYGWVVGVVALIAIAFAAYNSLVEVGTGEGVRGPEPGRPLPEFAAPTPTSGLEGDANVIQRGEAPTGSETPPACDVSGPGVVTVCGESGEPVVLTFVTTGCEEALDVVEDVRADFPDVRFVGVYSGESPDDVAQLAEQHGWGFEVAVDPDRPEVFSLYRAGDCPTTVLAAADGTVAGTALGPLDADDLSARIGEAADARPGG